MSITGSNNVLLGSGAQLPSAAGSHQIVLGAAADTVYLGGAGTSSAGGVIIGAAGVTLSGVATFTVSGQTGALGQALTSGGAAAAPYWGPPLPRALASADTPLALAAPLAGLYSVTGGTAWALSLPLPAQATGTGTWLKSMASAAGTVGGPVVTLGATAPTTVVTMAPGDGGYFESDGAAWWVLSANQVFPGSNVAPTVNSVQPNVGSPAGGTNITINGSNFVGNTSVTIGGVAVTGLNFISSTQITATTPAGSLGSASVVVTTPYGANPANTLFTFANVPTISSISPAVGPLGGSNTVTLTGSYFVAGATTVTIGGTQIAAASVTVTGTTSLTFVAPAGQNVGEVDVTVTTIGTSAPILYGYAQQFLATGANQTFAVPSGVAQIKTIVAGAVGGSGRDVGGGGCTITSTINVTPGQQLDIVCGTGTYGGGGFGAGYYGGGSGGGYSAILNQAAAIDGAGIPTDSNPAYIYVMAGGGGGGGFYGRGGIGGFVNGGSGNQGGRSGQGGTASAGGAGGSGDFTGGPGTQFRGGVIPDPGGWAGGGGGGWYGGGSGDYTYSGGGGSSYVGTGVAVSAHTDGSNSGAGYILIWW